MKGEITSVLVWAMFLCSCGEYGAQMARATFRDGKIQPPELDEFTCRKCIDKKDEAARNGRVGKRSKKAAQAKWAAHAEACAKYGLCGQCGEPFNAKACGPTHAVIWETKKRQEARP